MVPPYVCVRYFPIMQPLLSLVLFATFILILFFGYGTVIASLLIQYHGILLCEGYN
jgi:hypothetical protein